MMTTNATEGQERAPRSRRRAVERRSLRKRRVSRKVELVAALGGQCRDCGYSAAVAALDFHHRDPTSKLFEVGSFSGSRARLLIEAEKCDLLCAVCHRLRHAVEDARLKGGPVVEHRRRRKIRAVEYMGGACHACARTGPPAIFEFHHLDPDEKDFGITQDGIPRRWERIVAELAKCVMLCANCHREVHAGVREIDDGLLGLAEESAVYEEVA